jgi:hypothetical protein
MQKANTEQLLAEYMERFGKKLNEQESRTGDELFMWLKDKLTTETPAPQRELPGWETRFRNLQLCKCKNGKPCFDTMFDIESFIRTELKRERERIWKKGLNLIDDKFLETLARQYHPESLVITKAFMNAVIENLIDRATMPEENTL